MTDDPRLGRHRRPGSPPRADVLDAVVRDGRRRIRRSATMSAGALTLVAGAVLSLAVVSPARDDALELTPASPAPTTAPGVSPEPTPAPSSPSPTRTATVGSPGPSAVPGGPAGPVQGPQVQSPTPAGGPAPAVRPYRENPSEAGYGDACTGRAVPDTPGYRLCASSTSSVGANVRSGTSTTIEIRLCSSLSSGGDLTLTFRSGREHDVQVRRADTVGEYVWTWSRGYTFPEGAHSRVLERGSCLSWRTAWTTRDDDGRLVPPGDYRVEPTVELNGRTHRVPLDVTVTPA